VVRIGEGVGEIGDSLQRYQNIGVHVGTRTLFEWWSFL